MPQILIGEFGGITGIVLVSVWDSKSRRGTFLGKITKIVI